MAFALTLAGPAVFAGTTLAAGAALLAGLAFALTFAGSAMFAFAIFAAGAALASCMAFAFTLAGPAVFTATALAAGTAFLSGLAMACTFAGCAVFTLAVLAAAARSHFFRCLHRINNRHQCHGSEKHYCNKNYSNLFKHTFPPANIYMIHYINFQDIFQGNNCKVLSLSFRMWRDLPEGAMPRQKA